MTLSGIPGRRDFKDIEAAKAAAQQDYETRILSALVNAQADADVVERWQPIETAPRDGTIILLIGGVYGGLPFPGKWDKSEFVSPVARWFSSISKGHLYNHVPTHWRPIPAPPSTTRIADSAEAGGSATLSSDADEACPGEHQEVLDAIQSHNSGEGE